MAEFKHVTYLWEEKVAAGLGSVGLLVYRSNLLGSDQRITNTGGGNTSAKVEEIDPLTGKPVEVLWVKGSGGDLRTAGRDFFSSLYMDRLRTIRERYEQNPERGLKSPAEDAVVGLYPQATYNLNPRAPSIDTPLHAFVPHAHVDHTHPNAIIALAACDRGEELMREIFGEELIWIPWMRPGMELGIALAEACEKHPEAKGAILGQHGLINWASDAKECYELSLSLIERASEYLASSKVKPDPFGKVVRPALGEADRAQCLHSILPWLRGQLADSGPLYATIESAPAVLDFIGSEKAEPLAALGTSCPDHFLRTKIKPLWVDFDPTRDDLLILRDLLEDGIRSYREDYEEYYKRNREDGSPDLRPSLPTVILIPGIGMVAWGKTKSESRVTAEFYRCAIEVMAGAESVGRYQALPEKEAFDIEYWQMEEAKLRRMPPEKELSRKIIAVIGAGSGIGRTVAERLMKEGAHVVCLDVSEEAAQATADELEEKFGRGIGVAGSGPSSCGPVIHAACNITDRNSLSRAYEKIVQAYGGLDTLVVTAGIFVPPDTSGNIPDEKWGLTFSINVTGAYLAVDEANRIWNNQGLPFDVVLTTSANAVVAKKGSVAYDTSKAAANHLVRELAVTLAPMGRVNAIAPATVVAGSAMFPRDRVISSLAKYGIEYSNDESDDALRDRLAEFYAQRTLTRRPITTGDQAEAIFLLVSPRLGKTSGQIIPVDGGLTEAFLR